MTAQAYARCRCAECERLDRLPVHRHGIPHAWQPNMLNGCDVLPPPPECITIELPPQRELDGLPLFGGSLEPTLL